MKGHVRERGRGNWYAVIEIRDAITGKRKRKWHSLPGCDGKRKAQLECAQLIAAMQSGTYIEPNKVTLAEFLDRWLEHQQPLIAPGTAQTYREIIDKHLKPLLGSIALTKLQPMQVSQAYAGALTNGRRRGTGGLSPKTVSGCIAY
jgi:hypothetical protein